MQELISPAHMPQPADLSVPGEFYVVLPGLAGMPYPVENFPWVAVGEMGYRYVVDLTGQSSYDPAPLEQLASVRLQDLFQGGSPHNPQPEAAKIHALVRQIEPLWRAGDGIVIHCAGGRGRTGTVIGCLLRSLGYDADTVIAYLNDLHQARGREGWPESVWQSDLVRSWPVG
ncbi:MAG TPA: tyrosine-protein phosphatase [Anaerolineales bacterium]|nr:tyrosine-protein phosphatase [Anaerolineales bacterium]